MTALKNLYLVGAGGFGREVLSQIQDVHAAHGARWNIKGFLDDTDDPLQGKACDYGVVGTVRGYTPAPDDVLLMCITAPQAKREIVPFLKSKGAVFDSFVSPFTYMGRHNHIGEGAVITMGFGMAVNVQVGDFATLLGCALAHDVTVGDYCTILGRVGLLGNVTVGNGVFIGDSAKIASNVQVGDNAYVCMGSIVLKNVPAGAKVLGNPAREIGLQT